MTATSATGGPLPVPPGLDMTAIENAVAALIVALTGLEPELVRPRHQPRPPQPPPADAGWCAFGCVAEAGEGVQILPESRDGTVPVRLVTHDRIDVRVSFYGPAGPVLARSLTRGLRVAQNRALLGAGLVFVAAGQAIPAADLVGAQWVRRHDLTLTLRCAETAALPIEPLACAPTALLTDPSAPTDPSATEGGT